MDVPRYCRFCGAPLSESANFCPSCGKQVSKSAESSTTTPINMPVVPTRPATQTQPATQTLSPAPNAESIHLILPGANRHSGFLGMKVENFIIVFTNRRILFALQTQKKIQENIQKARQTAENQGKNFFGKWGAQLSANNGSQYWEFPPHRILAEEPENFAIEREHLRSIRMREQGGDEDAVSTYSMEFDTTAGKHKFRFGNLRIRELKKQFQELYGNVVR